MDNKTVATSLDVEIYSAAISFFSNGVKNRLDYEVSKDYTNNESVSYSINRKLIENGKMLTNADTKDINSSVSEIINILFADYYSVRTAKVLGFFDLYNSNDVEENKTYYFDFDFLQKKEKVKIKLYITENMDVIRKGFGEKEYQKEVEDNISLELDFYQGKDGSFIVEEDLIHYKIDIGEEKDFEIYSYEPVFVIKKENMSEIFNYMVSKLLLKKLITTEKPESTIEIKPA